jgi:hypothetical protein
MVLDRLIFGLHFCIDGIKYILIMHNPNYFITFKIEINGADCINKPYSFIPDKFNFFLN